MSKRLIPSLVIACALAMPALADDGTAGKRADTAAGPRDGTGPERVEPNGSMRSDDAMLGNRDESQVRNLTKDDVDQKVDTILESIKSSPDKASEKLFVLDAAMANQWEIEFSRLAEQKAQDQQVKELARMMVREHQQAQQRLMEIARQWDMDLPTSLSAAKQKKLDVIGSLPPEQFDSCYVMMLKADHARSITAYSDHEVAFKDDSLKAYISETLPKLKQHGQHVVQVAQAKDIGADNIALGGVSSEAGMLGNPDQSTDREVKSGSSHGTHGTHGDTNRKPTDTNPPR